MSIFSKFKLGLSKSSKSLSIGIGNLVLKKKIGPSSLNELEDFLIQSDVGATVANELVDAFSNTKILPKNENKKEIFKI